MVPEQLNDLALRNKELVYRLLFETSAATLQTVAADPKHLGVQIGFFSILHTWGQNLLFTPPYPLRRYRLSCRPGFFLCVRVLSRLFRRLFLGSARCCAASNG